MWKWVIWKAVIQAPAFQELEGFQNLGEGEPKLGAIAGTAAPAPRTTARQLHPHAQRLPDPQFLHVLHEEFQFSRFLDDRNDVLADLPGQHDHLDELIILEAVADDRCLTRSVGEGQNGQEFRLAAGFQSKAVRFAEVQHFLDDVPLLVHLDGVDAVVIPAIAVLLHRLVEGIGNVSDPMLEDVREAQKKRGLDAASADLIDEFLEVDTAFRVLVRVDGDVSELVDPKVPFAPILDAVGFEGIVQFPGGVQVGGVSNSPIEGLGHQRNLSRVGSASNGTMKLLYVALPVSQCRLAKDDDVGLSQNCLRKTLDPRKPVFV
jgi:hypothetical protein